MNNHSEMESKSESWLSGNHHTNCAISPLDLLENKTLGSLLDVGCLASHFGLTKAELIVSGYFLKGLSYTRIAKVRNVQKDTVKSQISSVLSKTGCANRANFILFVLLLSKQSPCSANCAESVKAHYKTMQQSMA